MKARLILILMVFLPVFAVAAAPKTKVSKPKGHTQVTLLAEVESVMPGDVFDIGLLLKMDKGWHTYTKDPGEAGLPTSVEWKLPPGFIADPIRWPKAEKIVTGGIISYGYEKEVLLPVAIHVPVTGLKKGQSFKIEGKVSWLECADTCIPGTSNVQISMKVGPAKASSKNVVDLFTKYRNLIPPDAPSHAVGPEEVMIDPPDLPTLSTDATVVEGRRSRTRELPQDKMVVLMSVSKAMWGGFLGGLILNLMPCVLPVLAIKVLSFVKQSGESSFRTRLLGMAFGLGVMFSFWCMALGVVLLQKAGHVVGWGSLLFQEPAFLMAMAIVVTVMSLNFLGVFEFELSSSSLTAAHGLSSREGLGGAFMNGVLATTLATPCTAPFLAPALGFAFSQPSTTIFAVLSMVGLGLALPYMVLTWNPSLLKWMPKPGPWMLRFRQFMALPMIGTAAWLVWNLGSHGERAAGYALAWLLAVSGVIWIISLLCKNPLKWVLLATLLMGWAGYAHVSKILKTALPANEAAEEPVKGLIDWKPYTSQTLQDSLRTSQVVFVDFTAKWCVTCQLNKKTSLEVETVAKRFNDLKVIPILADWTKKNDEITNLLSSFQRSGVPLYVVYPADRTKPPIILSEILTPQMVLDALEKAAGVK